MSRARGKNRKYRILALGVAGAAVVAGGVATSGAFAGEDGGTAGRPTAAQVISCPSAEGSLPQVPEQARAEVDRELAALEQQITEANERIVNTQGQGGPNFVQNAILGPLADKRTAALNRIETAIGRFADKPDGLEALAGCTLADGAGGTAQAPAAGAGEAEGGPAEPADGAEGAAPAGVATVACPDVGGQLAAVPGGAQAQVDRELAALEQQITEANERIVNTQGQGGPNFVQNAILGPLDDKRAAVLDRIGQALERAGGNRPAGLDALSTCGLNE
ncbi:hypothetical protein [Streptomyces zingiberis]|uniref:Secreted protein n=1 Tax=Streptomyces zingiberis TaxID=2053010 RepID=A0ABX1BVL4_9ACTN|nr:hypothetical protein [Streptomyces zingiberis]NJQ01716.1 hypothetical protein [Streptomyces zingiberis]